MDFYMHLHYDDFVANVMRVVARGSVARWMLLGELRVACGHVRDSVFQCCLQWAKQCRIMETCPYSQTFRILWTAQSRYEAVWRKLECTIMVKGLPASVTQNDIEACFFCENALEHAYDVLYVLEDMEGVRNGNSCIINLVRGSLYKRVRQVLAHKFAEKSCSLYFEFAVIQGKVANDIVRDGQETRRDFLEENVAFLLDE